VSIRFSTRTAWDTGESSLAAAVRRARGEGRELIDLTVSNPTVCGFEYDAEAILDPLKNARALTYDPDPRGMRSAREAVAEYYAGHRAEVHPDAIVLTTSTSEAYGYLFRLLCDAGDEVLVAQPSYPLFDFLADLEDVRLTPYPLFYDYGWWIDFAELERRIGPRTRAIIVVHPNNPTGHGTKPAERQRLEDLAAKHGLALIVDEVFLDFSFSNTGNESLVSFTSGENKTLIFVLSGLSKIAGLPQMKVGWIVCRGPETGMADALSRLEVIADTFLSMNAPAQLALPAWLGLRDSLRRQILERCTVNLGEIDAYGIERLMVEAGWNAVLRLPRIDLGALELLDRASVIVHPGEFYGMQGSDKAIVSLICPEDDFREGMRRIASCLGR